MRIVNELPDSEYDDIFSRTNGNCVLVCEDLPRPLSRVNIGLARRSEEARYNGEKAIRTGLHVYGTIEFLDPEQGKKFFEGRPEYMHGIWDIIKLPGYEFRHRRAYLSFARTRDRRGLITRRDLEQIGQDFVRGWFDRLTGSGAKRKCLDVFEVPLHDTAVKPVHYGIIDNSSGNIVIDLGGRYGYSRLPLDSPSDPDLINQYREQIKIDLEFTCKAIEALLEKLSYTGIAIPEREIILSPVFD